MAYTSRPFRSAGDLNTMYRILSAGRLQDSEVYYVHPGDLSWWLYYLSDSDWRHDVMIWNDASLSPIAWTLLSPRYSAFDVFVNPLVLRSGRVWIIRESIAWAVTTYRSMGLASASTTWVDDQDVDLIQELESAGFTRDDEHTLHLVHSLVDIPAQRELEGYAVRQCRGLPEVNPRALANYLAFNNNRPWDSYVQRWREFMASDAYASAHDWIACAPDGRIAAFATGWVDSLSSSGHFEPVGTHPDYRRRGLATGVLLHGLREIKALRCRSADVCVNAGNDAARSLYESVGFRLRRTIIGYHLTL